MHARRSVVRALSIDGDGGVVTTLNAFLYSFYMLILPVGHVYVCACAYCNRFVFFIVVLLASLSNCAHATETE